MVRLVFPGRACSLPDAVSIPGDAGHLSVPHTCSVVRVCGHLLARPRRGAAITHAMDSARCRPVFVDLRHWSQRLGRSVSTDAGGHCVVLRLLLFSLWRADTSRRLVRFKQTANSALRVDGWHPGSIDRLSCLHHHIYRSAVFRHCAQANLGFGPIADLQRRERCSCYGVFVFCHEKRTADFTNSYAATCGSMQSWPACTTVGPPLQTVML